MGENLAKRPYDPNAPRESAVGGLAGPFGTGMRLAAQIVGLLLIVLGAYYAMHILGTVLQIARDPAEMETAVAGMARTLGLEDATVPVQDERLVVGRPAAVGALLLWYLVAALIVLKLISAGGHLVLGVVAERREFLAAMREFLVTMRQEGAAAPPRKP